MKDVFHQKKTEAASARKLVMLRLKRAGTYSWSLDALPTRVSLPHRRSRPNSSRSLRRPKQKTTAFCYQMPQITSMLGPLTFKKSLVVRRSSSWSSLSTCLALIHSQSRLRVHPRSLTILGWKVASSNLMIRSASSSTTLTMKSLESSLNMHRDTEMTIILVLCATNSSMLTCHMPDSGLTNLRRELKPMASVKSKFIATKI